MPGNGSNGGMARRSREQKKREETAAIGYVAAKKQEEMEAAAVGLQHATITDQLIDLKKALDNNLLTQEEHDLQRSRVLGTEIVEPVVVTVAIAPRVKSPEQKELEAQIFREEMARQNCKCKACIGLVLIVIICGLAFVILGT